MASSSSSSSSPTIHLFKKSAIEAGTPGDYYLDPSDNLMKITSDWSVVEHEDHLVLSVDLIAIGDLVLLAPEPEKDEIQIHVVVENKEKAASLKHKDGMKVFRIKINPKFIKKIDREDDATYKVLPEDPSNLARIMIFKLKLKESAVMASSSSSSPKIHLFKKTAIEDGTPGDYYLDPSDNLMKITSAWGVVEHEDHLVLTIKLLSIGDLVGVGLQKDVIHIFVIRENKEKAARFHHKDGMDNFSIKLNPKFVKYVQGDDNYRGLPDATVMLFIKKLKFKKSSVRICDLDE